jgi:hypothetical protein
MTAQELYDKLNELGWDWECREVFEGLRVINIVVEEEDEEEDE